MNKLVVLVFCLLINISFVYGQKFENLLDSNIQLISRVRSDIDTSCVSSAVYRIDTLSGWMSCGAIKAGNSVGKWIYFNGRILEYIKYYSINGNDSVDINLISEGTSLKSISLNYPRIWADFYRDTLEELTWETTDTTRMKYVFYSSGQVKSFGELFFPYLPHLTEPLPFEEGRGKNKEWIYFNQNGQVVRKEWWEKGTLIKSEE